MRPSDGPGTAWGMRGMWGQGCGKRRVRDMRVRAADRMSERKRESGQAGKRASGQGSTAMRVRAPITALYLDKRNVDAADALYGRNIDQVTLDETQSQGTLPEPPECGGDQRPSAAG